MIQPLPMKLSPTSLIARRLPSTRVTSFTSRRRTNGYRLRGKVAYTWNRTAVTGDPDINPEGLGEKLSWDFKTPVLKNFTLQAMQLLFNEVTAGTDSYALGGQVASQAAVWAIHFHSIFHGVEVEQP